MQLDISTLLNNIFLHVTFLSFHHVFHFYLDCQGQYTALLHHISLDSFPIILYKLERTEILEKRLSSNPLDKQVWYLKQGLTIPEY